MAKLQRFTLPPLAAFRQAACCFALVASPAARTSKQQEKNEPLARDTSIKAYQEHGFRFGQVVLAGAQEAAQVEPICRSVPKGQKWQASKQRAGFSSRNGATARKQAKVEANRAKACSDGAPKMGLSRPPTAASNCLRNSTSKISCAIINPSIIEETVRVAGSMRQEKQ